MSTTSQVSLQEILEQFDGYIASLARKNIPLSIVHMEMIDLEIDDLNPECTRSNSGWL